MKLNQMRDRKISKWMIFVLSVIFLGACQSKVSFEAQKAQFLAEATVFEIKENGPFAFTDPDAVVDLPEDVNLQDLPHLDQPVADFSQSFENKDTKDSVKMIDADLVVIKHPVQYLCSDARSRRQGDRNLMTIQDPRLVVVDVQNSLSVKPFCELQLQTSELFDKKALSFVARCRPETIRGNQPARPALVIVDEEDLQLSFHDSSNRILLERNILASGASSHFNISTRLVPLEVFLNNDQFEVKTDLRPLTILYDFNRKSNNLNFVAGNDSCDRRSSPLIIDTSPKNEPQVIKLSSPTNGILFDILGKNSFPHPHAKKQISWPMGDRYKWLVLPNAAGRVEGIDQLFGDNTLGPDGLFATDGYHALSKYDENGDGVINRKDSIFSELRLWADKDRSGESSPDELWQLEEFGIVEIDLNYDSAFSEKDVYGNSTEMKSVVRKNNGEFRLIFDLWFRYL